MLKPRRQVTPATCSTWAGALATPGPRCTFHRRQPPCGGSTVHSSHEHCSWRLPAAQDAGFGDWRAQPEPAAAVNPAKVCTGTAPCAERPVGTDHLGSSTPLQVSSQPQLHIAAALANSPVLTVPDRLDAWVWGHELRSHSMAPALMVCKAATCCALQGASMSATVFNLVNVIMGAGYVSIPFACK